MQQYAANETLTIGSTFDGCLHEIAIHARALSLTEVSAVADYMGAKWGSPSASLPALAPPPPPPLPALAGTDTALQTWALAMGTAAVVPAALATVHYAPFFSGSAWSGRGVEYPPAPLP